MTSLRKLVSPHYYRFRDEQWPQWSAQLQVALLHWRHRLPEVRLAGAPAEPLPPPILQSVCMPPLQHNATLNDHDDFTPLMNLVRMRRPAVVVELGTAFGNTVANICQVDPAVRVLTVNAPAEKQTGAAVTYALDEGAIGTVYRQYGYADRVTQIFENTLHLDLARHTPRRSVGLAIIDACHDAEYVINDFHKVEPFLRDDGVALFHDTHPSMAGHLRGSYLGCVALRRQGWDVRHLRDTWWGVWTRDWARAPFQA